MTYMYLFHPKNRWSSRQEVGGAEWAGHQGGQAIEMGGADGGRAIRVGGADGGRAIGVGGPSGWVRPTVGPTSNSPRLKLLLGPLFLGLCPLAGLLSLPGPLTLPQGFRERLNKKKWGGPRVNNKHIFTPATNNLPDRQLPESQ